MSEEKKEVYRLFKVAKELNVGSSTLVEHLSAKGFELKNSPNEKLTSDMYAILLRDFASEKVLKEKAVQIKEQKKEARQQSEEASVEEESHLSAEQLRSGILEKKSSAEKAAAKTTAKKVAPPVTPPIAPPVVETPPVAETPVAPPVAEPAVETPAADGGIKVLRKIDLSQFDKKKKPAVKEPPKKEKESRPVEVVKTPEEKVAEPVAETPVAPVAEVVETTEPVVTPAESDAPAEEKNEVIRAADHGQKLQGLTVKGKIELPGTDRRPRKGKEEATKVGTPGSTEDDKKRKRKRKRKKTTQVDTNTNASRTGTSGPSKSGPVKKDGRNDRNKPKEELTDKEIQEKIRSTLAELNKKAGRTRQRLRRGKRDEAAQRREVEEARALESSRVLDVTEFITANEFANLIGVPVTEIITKCMQLGLFVSINQRLEADVLQLIADEYGFQVKFVDVTETVDEGDEDYDPELAVTRPPIVTIMGHVDHGKTSLLDYLRKTNVVAGEAGGITQHIGAYVVSLDDGRGITFLDTPGHEAFTAMRARGAKVTDIVVIVVAADDNVMPQTKEAINHAQAAGVPMVFAINKVDKPNANPEKIREQLSAMNILVEDWGGKYQAQNLSAKSGQGVKDLLEKILIEAEMLQLTAVVDAPARGTVIESELDKGRGVVATVLVEEGTMKVGDSFVAGIHFGKVKALVNERGERIESAGPATPVQVLGFQGKPNAGDTVKVYEEERKAKEIATRRQELYREQSLRQTKHITLEEIARRKAIGDFQKLNLIVKGDVDGSVEALSDSLLKLGSEGIKVEILMKGVGQITESDVLLASASDAIIIGFQVRPSAAARKLAETEAIDIRLYSIIYDAINDVTDALEGMLSPELKEEIVGSAEIREVFKVSKVGSVAGCMVTDGKIFRSEPIRLVRDGIVIYEGKLSTLKRFKDDAKEVATGFECGLTIDNYNDIKVGDVVECFRTSEVKRTLN